MRRTFQVCAGLILGGVLLSSVGCQSTGGGWGASPGGSWFSNWKAPTWPQPWSTGGGTSLASAKTLPSNSSNPTQPQSSVTNPTSSYAGGGNGAAGWGQNYPSSTAPGGYSNGPSGYDPNAGYGGANNNVASAAGYGAGNAGGYGGGSPANYNANTGYGAAPVGYQQPATPPAGNYQQGPYGQGGQAGGGYAPAGGSSYNGGGYNNAPPSGGGGGYDQGGYNNGGAAPAGGGYGTGGGSGYNGYQGSQNNVQPPTIGYDSINQPAGYAQPSPRAGAYAAPAEADTNNYAAASASDSYANTASNAALKSAYEVQPASAQEPIAGDAYASPPAEVAAAPGAPAGVLSGTATIPSSLSNTSGYRPGSTGGQYMR